MNQSGGAISEWAGTGRNGRHDQYWEQFDAKYTGQDIFLQVCVRDIEKDHMDSDIETTIEMLTKDRNVSAKKIWLTALQRYPAGHDCAVAAPVPEIEDAVKDAIKKFKLSTGPVLQIDSIADLEQDGCHLNAEGQIVIGHQMVDFFDGGK